MQLSIKGYTDDQAEAKRNECIVRLRIRENDVKSQMWKLMSDNSYHSLTSVEQEIGNIFKDLDAMIVDVFDTIQGKFKARPDEKSKGDEDASSDSTRSEISVTQTVIDPAESIEDAQASAEKDSSESADKTE